MEEKEFRCLCGEDLSVLYGSCHDQRAFEIWAPLFLIYMKEMKMLGEYLYYPHRVLLFRIFSDLCNVYQRPSLPLLVFIPALFLEKHRKVVYFSYVFEGTTVSSYLQRYILRKEMRKRCSYAIMNILATYST